MNMYEFFIWIILMGFCVFIFIKYSKNQAKKLTDLYWHSMLVYIFKNDDEAAAGVILLFNIFGDQQRKSSFKATAGFINKAILNTPNMDSKLQLRASDLISNLEKINARSNSDVGMLSIMKVSISEKYPELVNAINRFDNEYFKIKHPDMGLDK